ncbi:MAG: hypothetical protein ACI87O_001602 [Planctomycetota bacterium]|jgi:hypothetical protein
MQSKANTVKEYLVELPADRRKAFTALRKVIKANLGKGFKEVMQYGMISYVVPHSVYPKGYHCTPERPLPFCSLGSQKNHMAWYSFFLYMDGGALETFQDEWQATGNKLDMGKSCVRFKKIEDASLDAIGNAIARIDVHEYMAIYEAAFGSQGKPKSSGKKATTKKAAKKAPAKKATAKKATAKKATAKKATAKKATAKKATAKKATAKKATAKKPVVKKAAAKKTAKKAGAKKVMKKATKKVAKKPTAKKKATSRKK